MDLSRQSLEGTNADGIDNRLGVWVWSAKNYSVLVKKPTLRC